MHAISEKLVKYLRVQLNNPLLDIDTELKNIEGGFHTEIFGFSLSGTNGDLSKKLILRLFPERSTEAVLESTIQNALASIGYPTAKAIIVCTDITILGGPFFIMEYLKGQLLMFEPEKYSAQSLGKAHAELHSLSTTDLDKELSKQGVEAWHLDDRFDWIASRVEEMAWLNETFNWLLENKPKVTQKEVICHGDFHGLNVLTDNGSITGVLDWTSFLFANPTYDVARTVLIHKHTARHIPMLSSDIDWDLWVKRYLASYQECSKFELDDLDYFVVLHCVVSLIYGHGGIDFWRLPPIEKGLIDCILTRTGVQVQIP
tara:strand:- start:609 stop:1556 length:948 start_codon:yes stop_codon:yes gene_type:complete